MKKLTKWFKSPWGISLGTAVFSFLLFIIYDLITLKPVLSTLGNIISDIFSAVVLFLNFELKVWWVLTGVVLTILVFYVVIKIYMAKDSNMEVAEFLDYTCDIIQGWNWEWSWRKGYDGKYSLENLHPVCPKCNTPYIAEKVYISSVIKCPRCNYTPDIILPDFRHIEVVIYDNVKRNLSKKSD